MVMNGDCRDDLGALDLWLVSPLDLWFIPGHISMHNMVLLRLFAPATTAQRHVMQG